MIPTMPASAKETTETVTSALKSLYTNAASSLQCSDSLSNLRLPSECSALNNDDSVQLDWRSSDHNLSDLSLVIYDGSGGRPYHVHTLLLAFGGRKSNFISDQIKQQQKKKQQVNVAAKHNNNDATPPYKIEIYVPPLAAGFMPQFLDYIYGAHIDLSTHNAPPLRYLSNRFDVRELHAQISKFLPMDLELATAPRYCMAADQLKDYELRDKALRIMAERMERMNSGYLKEMSPRLMRSLVQCERMECGGEILSEKVAEWLRCRDHDGDGGNCNNDGIDDFVLDAHDKSSSKTNNHHNNNNNNNYSTLKQPIPLTDEDFYWITHIQYMPSISQHEALFYLAYSSKFPSVMNEVGPGSLRYRCLQACSGSWAMDHLVSHLERPEQVPMNLYQNLETKLKVQLLENALISAKKLTNEKEKQSATREGYQRDIQQSNDIMYETLNREYECPNNNNMVKSNKLVILGCGIHPANGVYIANNAIPPISPKATTTITTASPLSTTYEKESIWNGTPCTFVLSPYQSGKFYTHYKVSVRKHNVTKVLYTSPTLTSEEKIPEQGWEVEGVASTDDNDDIGDIYPAPLFVGRILGES